MRVDCAVAPEPNTAVTTEPPAESLKDMVKKASKKSNPVKAEVAPQGDEEETVAMLVPASLGIDYEHEMINGVKRKTHTGNINGKKFKVILGQINDVPVWAEPVLANYIKCVAGLKVAR
jgi:hypothetical protein